MRHREEVERNATEIDMATALDLAELGRAEAELGKLALAENKRQLWIPAGFAHGFLTLTDTAEFLYKTTDYYAPQHERCLRWDDPSVAIDWPLQRLADAALQLSAKDQVGAALMQAETYA